MLNRYELQQLIAEKEHELKQHSEKKQLELDTLLLAEQSAETEALIDQLAHEAVKQAEELAKEIEEYYEKLSSNYEGEEYQIVFGEKPLMDRERENHKDRNKQEENANPSVIYLYANRAQMHYIRALYQIYVNSMSRGFGEDFKDTFTEDGDNSRLHLTLSTEKVRHHETGEEVSHAHMFIASLLSIQNNKPEELHPSLRALLPTFEHYLQKTLINLSHLRHTADQHHSSSHSPKKPLRITLRHDGS